MSAVTPVSLPFSIAEYQQRRQRACGEMRARGIDQLYVTSPANLLYLSGYSAIWYPNRLPVGAVLDAASGELVVLDWNRHAGYVESSVLCDDVALFAYGQSTDVVHALFERKCWLGGTVAIEWSSPHPSSPIMAALAERLGASGSSLVSGDWIVDGLRLYKSPAELDYIRRAAKIADAAMLQLQRDLKPGMTELEVSAHLGLLLARGGSELAATPVLVNSGPTAWRDVHSFPSNRVLQRGDLISVDCCGVLERYHANLCRTFLLGDRPTRVRDIIADGAGCWEVLKAQAGVNQDPAPAMAAALAYVQARVPQDNIWWIGGYALGLGQPPSWVGHTYLANDGVERCRLLPGYVSNFENVYCDPEEGFEGGCIDTLIMTEQGLEMLSTIPRELLVVPV
jgi:Xaa-Pro aminopeptidase